MPATVQLGQRMELGGVECPAHPLELEAELAQLWAVESVDRQPGRDGDSVVGGIDA